MKVLLFAVLCAAGLVAAAQSRPIPATTTSQQPGPLRAEAGVTARSYTTRPHALRVAVPDTAGQKMKRANRPSALPNAGWVVPLPEQQQVPR